MTRDELRDELPLLAAFVKIVLLDRRLAHVHLGTWLESVAATQETLHQLARADAYGAFATLAPGSRNASVPNDDPLSDPVFQQTSPRERAWQFLAGPAGFTADAADAILGEREARRCDHEGEPGSWPDVRLLREAS